MGRLRRLSLFLVVMLVVLVAASPLFAAVLQASAPATPTPLAVKVLAIATIVFGLLQTVKKIFPQISGKVGIIFNVAFSAVGVIVAVPVDQLLTLNTAFLLVSAILTAAGIHGTWKLGLQPSDSGVVKPIEGGGQVSP